MRPRPYSDPYVTGACLGLVLLAAFVITGRGLGASGAFATTAAGLTRAIAPTAAEANPYFARYLIDGDPSVSTIEGVRPSGRSYWREWLLFELGGVAIGGFVSAWLAGRLRGEVERGPGAPRRARLVLAFGGGAAMGLGAVLARGCTSGLALTGGALLSVGSWLFMLAAFAGAYLAAPAWRAMWNGSTRGSTP
jgi:uncharacterized membrane protein YedE/YeeE